MKLQDRVALVTGGSSGIGRAAAVAMAAEGAKVAITARRAERCQEAVAEIEEAGGQALALPGDVAEPWFGPLRQRCHAGGRLRSAPRSMPAR